MIEPLIEAERLLDIGLLDQAEDRFARILEADPGNSIAVVGLARVALERGDDAGSLELARRAAAIDPENPVAARMIARFEEVAAARGEPVAPPSAAAVPLPSAEIDARPSAGAEPRPTPPTEAAPATEPPASPAPPPPAPPTRPTASPPRRRGLLGRILGRR